MIQRLVASAVLLVVTSTIIDSTITHSQPSSAPTSSLSTTPLSPNSPTPDGIASCDLCRKLEGRPGSDLKLHRRPRDKHLHTQKKAQGISKSLTRSLRSQLPHRKLDDEDDQRAEQEDVRKEER
jgi:hypothetical protein